MSAPYCLAIDIGTSRTSAAIARSAPDGSLLAAPFPLGRSSDNAPTVAFAADGELLFGDAAERRGHTQPDRLIREYKRRIGDDVPILAADRAFAPEELYALTVDWAARAVVEREGATPDRLAITVPAAWGGYRSDLVREALTAQGWRDVVVLSEPEAAARHYEATHPLADGGVLAVYDFGGGTFDAVALRKEAGGAVRIAGTPHGIADLGGADFDDTILRHVIRTAQVDATALSGTSSGRMALAALRRECVDAKESLSFDCEAVVPVLLGTDHRSVRLSRDEFEVMIADDLERTVEAFQSALDAAGVDVAELEAILLTGGTSRIPRVAQVLSERFDRPIAVDADPKAIIALGAARAAADAAYAASASPAGDEGETAVITLLDDRVSAAPSAAPRRGWFRRVPSGAFVTVGAAVLITGMGIAGAPALGSATLSVAERTGTTVEPVSLSDREETPSEASTTESTGGSASVAPGPPTAAPPRTPAKKPSPTSTAAKRTAAQAPRTAGTSGGSPSAPAAPAGGGTAQPAGGSTPTTGSGTATTPAGEGGSSTTGEEEAGTAGGGGATTGGTDGGTGGGATTGGTDGGTGGGATTGGTDGGTGGTGTGGETGGGDTGGTGTGGETGGGDGTGGDGTAPGGGDGTEPPTDPAPEESTPPPDPSPSPAAV